MGSRKSGILGHAEKDKITGYKIYANVLQIYAIFIRHYMSLGQNNSLNGEKKKKKFATFST
jgi:hypothetical protein